MSFQASPTPQTAQTAQTPWTSRPAVFDPLLTLGPVMRGRPILDPRVDHLPLSMPLPRGSYVKILEPAPSLGTTRYGEPPPYAPLRIWDPDIHGIGAMAFMAKRHNRRPAASQSEPLFSLDRIASLPLADQIAAAIRHHRDRAIKSGALSRSGRLGVTRRGREEAAAAFAFHSRVVRLLETPDDQWSTESKRMLVLAVHHRDPSVQAFVESELPSTAQVLDPRLLLKLDRQLFGALNFGPPDPVRLPSPEELDGDALELAEAFFERYCRGESAVAIVDFCELPQNPGGPGDTIRPFPVANLDIPPTTPREVVERIDQIGRSRVAAILTCAYELSRKSGLIDNLRRNLYQLERYVALLERALQTLGFPLVVPVPETLLGIITDPGLRESVAKTLTHRSLTLREDLFQGILDFDRAALDSARAPQSHFPVVIEVPAAANVDGSFSLSSAPRMTFYAGGTDIFMLAERIDQLGIGDRVTLHGFLPPSSIALAEIAGLLNTTVDLDFARGRLEDRLVELTLEKLEAGEEATLEGYPAGEVRQTRQIFANPRREVERGRQVILGNLPRLRRETTGAVRETVEGIFEMLGDGRIPLWIRAAIRDISNQPEVNMFGFLMDVVPYYRRIGATGSEGSEASQGTIRTLCRIILEGYFAHFPWAEEIMIEAGLRHEAMLGDLGGRTPLGIKAIGPEDRRNGHRFVFVATQLAMVPEERVRYFMEMVTQIPTEDPAVRRRRWERLAGLSSRDHPEAFDFIERYRGPFYDTRLTHFLGGLRPRSTDEVRKRRFVTGIAQRAAFHRRQVDDSLAALNNSLQGLAGDDEATQLELTSASSLLAYHLSSTLPPETVAPILQHMADILPNWGRLEEEPEHPDPLVLDLIGLTDPRHLAVVMTALGEMITEDGFLREPIHQLLLRQGSNPHAVHYLLLLVHLLREGSYPEDWILNIFRREETLSTDLNRTGKIKNDTFFKEALLRVLSGHFKRIMDTSSDAELAVLREFVERDDTTQVEVLPETWQGPVPDMRIHPKEGTPFLVEVKTLQHRSRESFDDLRARFRETLRQAESQLYAQHRQTGERRNRIFITIEMPPDTPLTPDQRDSLTAEAGELVMRHSKHMANIEIRQKTT